MVVLHHTHVVVALSQGCLSLDVEAVGVPCTTKQIRPISKPSSPGYCAEARVCQSDDVVTTQAKMSSTRPRLLCRSQGLPIKC